MKIKFLFGFIFLVFTNQGLCQNPIWAIPSNTVSSSYFDHVSFGAIPFPTIDPIGLQPYNDVIPNLFDAGGYTPAKVPHNGAANAISGPDGNLLFFIIGNSIFDRDGRTIYTALYPLSAMPVTSGYSEICVVPNPWNCNQYYLFTEREIFEGFVPIPVQSSLEEYTVTEAYYAILDVSLLNDNINFNTSAKGRLIQPFTSLTHFAGFSSVGVPKSPHTSFAASRPSRVDGSVTVVTLTNVFDDNYEPYQRLLKFKIYATGIQYIGFDVLFNTSNSLTSGIKNPALGRCELELFEMNDFNYRIATSNNQQIIAFDLSWNTLDIISGSKKVKPVVSSSGQYNSIRGIEISDKILPGNFVDAGYVYFTHQPNLLLPEEICLWDITTNAFIPLNIPTNADTELQYSYIEMDALNNLFFITDQGLSRLSNAFNPTIPASEFTANIIPYDYPANYWDYQDNTYELMKRYPLPDQIDAGDYYGHFANDPSCCIYAKPYDVDFFTADANMGLTQIWNAASNPLKNGSAVAYISGDLVIPAGMNVTISGMTLYFHPDAKIIVERSNDPNLPNGAKLTLSNCNLTVDDRCGDVFMWQGIIVEGHYGQSQMPINNSKQGFLQMYSSTIANAKVGAQAYGPADPITGALNPSNRGGIIRTSNSEFLNNRIDVRIYNYVNTDANGFVIDNQSLFVNTVFKTDGLLNVPSPNPLAHAFLYQSGGIKFVGCDFINVDETAYAENERGMGIFNVRNKLTVIPGCSSPSLPCTVADPNTFTNLSIGIYSIAGVALIGLDIRGNNFTNNFIGVYAGGLIGSKILNNNFEILRSSNFEIDYNQTTGIYLNGCTKYKVEENIFQDFNDPFVSSANTRGIVVNNSGEEHNEIYKNTFHDLLVGGQSQKINAVEVVTFPVKPNIVGLQWLCNDFQANIDVDLYVSSGRIDFYQGYTLPPAYPHAPYVGARNLFSIQPGDYEIVTTPTVNNIIYSHYSNPNMIPTNTLGNSSNSPIGLGIIYSNSCPTKISTTIEGSGILHGKKNQLKLEIEAQNALIDGGSTTGLLNLIQTSSGGNLKNSLLAASPYLSDEVLLVYLATNPPAGHVNQILQANSPLSDAVLTQFNSMSFPNGIKNQVNSVQNGTSAIEYLYSNINHLNTDREYYIDELIRYYLYDTIIVNPIDSIIAVLFDEDKQDRKEQLCDTYIIKGDLANAIFVRNQIITDHGASNYTDLAEINIATRPSSDPIDAANSDPSMHATIEYIANDSADPRICPRGEGMLYEFIYADAFVHDIEDLYLPGQGPKSMITSNEVITETQSISVYPNPATNNLFVEIIGYENTQNFVIDFYNLVGQKILSVPMKDGQQGIKIDVSAVPAGIYFVHVRDTENSISVTKVIVE